MSADILLRAGMQARVTTELQSEEVLTLAPATGGARVSLAELFLHTEGPRLRRSRLPDKAHQEPLGPKANWGLFLNLFFLIGELAHP